MAPNPPKPAATPQNAAPKATPAGVAFASLPQLAQALVRLERMDGAVATAPVAAARSHLSAQPLATAPLPDCIAWLDRLESLLPPIHEELEELTQELVAQQADLDPALLRQQILTDPQNAIRQELNQLKGSRFSQERQEWKRRIDENINEFKNRHAQQVQKKLDVKTEDSGDQKLTIGPSDDWFSAYQQWQQQQYARVNKFIADLLFDRWTRFTQREVAQLVRHVNVDIDVALPVPAVEQLPNPFDASTPVTTGTGRVTPRERATETVSPPWRNSWQVQLGAITAPVAVVTSIKGLTNLPMPAVVGLGSVALAIGSVMFWRSRKSDEQRHEREKSAAVEKGIDTLKKKMIQEFNEDIAKHSKAIDRFAREYATEVQQATLDRVEAVIHSEMQRRSDQLLPEKKRLLTLRQREIRERIDLLAQSSKALSTALVDMSLRRDALARELERSV